MHISVVAFGNGITVGESSTKVILVVLFNFLDANDPPSTIFVSD